MSRNYYSRLHKYHLYLIQRMIDGEPITADDEKLGILRREYSRDFLNGLQVIGSECLFKDKLFFCENKNMTDYIPVYPFFIIDWDELRKMGVPVLDRQSTNLIIPLCLSCTLLAFKMKTKYFKDIVKGRWTYFLDIWDSCIFVLNSTFQSLLIKADNYIRTLGVVQTETIELGGLVTRIGLEGYYKSGKITITRLVPADDYVPLLFGNR